MNTKINKNYLPKNTWQINGEATDKLLLIFILYFKYRQKDLQWNDILPKIVEHLRKSDTKTWKRKTDAQLMSSIGQQIMWGISTQKSLRPERAFIYALNHKTANRAEKIAKFL